MFESVYDKADVTRLVVRSRLRRTVISRYALLPHAVLTAPLPPSDAARLAEAAAKSETIIDPEHFRLPLGRSRLLFLAGHISASVAGSNIYLKIETSPVLRLAILSSITFVAWLAARGWTAIAITCAIAILISLAVARRAAFRLIERVALSLPEGQASTPVPPHSH